MAPSIVAVLAIGGLLGLRHAFEPDHLAAVSTLATRPGGRRLWSAARLALPITFIVLKNRRYAALQEFAPTFGFGPDEPLAGTELPDIDFVALARGQGCRGANVNSARHLRDALIDALQASAPTLVEVDVA